MSLSDINIREKEFHNRLQSTAEGRFENIFYKAIFNLSNDYYTYLKSNCENKNVLDYGCGTGITVKKISEYKPKKITGIDISEVSIEKAKQEAKDLNIEVEYKVDNCEKSSLESKSYDIIYGAGILHHLNMEKCINEIHRLLKKDGNMVFLEPLGTNPLINIYRKLTPKSRSRDEHPLTKKDFQLLEKKYSEVKVKYYGLLTLVFFPFYKSPQKSKVFKFLAYLDQMLFKIKFMRSLAWSVLIISKKN